MDRSNLLTAMGFLLIAALFWGGMFHVSMTALAVMDAYYLTLIRFIATVLILVLLLVLREGIAALKLEGRFGYLLFVGSLGFAGFNLLAFSGLAHSKPEHGAIIMGLQPMLAVILAWVLKGKKPALFTLGTVVLAFLGVFLVITGGDPAAALEGGAVQWDLLFLSGALCWVGYTMGAQAFPHWSALRYTTVTAIMGTATVAVITLVLTLAGELQVPELETVVSLRWVFAYLTIGGSVIAVLCWNTGIKVLGPVNGVLFINVVPITAFTAGVLMGHTFGVAELVGAALVILALISNNLYLRKASAKAPPAAQSVGCRT